MLTPLLVVLVVLIALACVVRSRLWKGQRSGITGAWESGSDRLDQRSKVISADAFPVCDERRAGRGRSCSAGKKTDIVVGLIAHRRRRVGSSADVRLLAEAGPR